jgi:hypothetical protein
MNTRLVAVLYAFGITLYISFMSGFFSSLIEPRVYLICCAILFIVSFFSVHIYYKVEAIEDKLNKKRRVNKHGRTRKKNKG